MHSARALHTQLSPPNQQLIGLSKMHHIQPQIIKSMGFFEEIINHFISACVLDFVWFSTPPSMLY